MVKCYELIVVKKENDGSSIAFYVNAKNSTNGAYMYVQNVRLDAKSVNSVVDNTRAGEAHFYYNDVTYDYGAKIYEKTSTYLYNQAISPDDWNWD